MGGATSAIDRRHLSTCDLTMLEAPLEIFPTIAWNHFRVRQFETVEAIRGE